ncbi:bifunctional adenosylcobinamide kinase/adenosylcobinamide-phosphate guanylyltransferase [Fuchsiella alkaliacetigena]|uniref:bifunctional adenosylcobinamide kinase/adenosylcobinamide-phosphate guanylyltransferase n=1 Tax=Fuchsiella alkaliacetigena TaxID=957042 RepID=UPI00200A93DE|nr:bifunctional adenosylcobinamide kinase/adenosylcobinamide-phosphate guanylyltransferase [Fuchsiella alkaliacetigena]MCK8825521.1 bifunctional adenosylcobinamide kinase/adenosylcobinamide-phosphate guanylyltransferase [Fuchsiella alkaliacetigena]
MKEGKVILVLGGAKSGKSSFAEEIAYSLAKEEVTYIATAEARDEEMVERIKHHQAVRPDQWKTVEETMAVADLIPELGAQTEVILLDCLTVLISNLLLQGEELGTDDYHFEQGAAKSKQALKEVENLVKAAKETTATIIIVSNEVGQGLVPPYPLSRVYRDTVGAANKKVAELAHEVYITYAGLPVEIKELSNRIKERFGGLEDDS